MKKLFLQLIGLVCLFFLTQGVGMAIAYMVAYLFCPQEQITAFVEQPGVMAWMLVLSNVLMCAILFLLRWHKAERFRLNGIGVKDFVATIALMVPVIFIVNMVIEFFDPVDLIKDTILDLAYHPIGVATIVLIGPLTEELVFRMGVMELMMKKGVAPWLAILFSSLIFGVAHGNPVQIPGGILIGMVLGWLYWRSSTIWLPVVAHVFNNFLGIVVMWSFGGEETTVEEISGGDTFMWGFALVNMVIGYVLYRYLERRFARLTTAHEKERDNDEACSATLPNGD